MPAKKPSKPRSGAKKSSKGSPTRRQRGAGASSRGKKRAPKKVAAAKAPRSWKWSLAREAVPVALGVAAGLAMTSFVLWRRANHDVQAFLAKPPESPPTVVWSAPEQVRVGEQASLSEIAGDLLAAGYERVGRLTAPQQFTVDRTHLHVWTAPFSQAGVSVPGGKASLVVSGGRVTSIGGGDTVVFRPTALATLGDRDEARHPVHLADLSPYVAPAVLSMEDRRFREHGGIDPLGILRAMAHDLLHPGNLHGGSTITQQLAKNLFLTQQRTLARKVREAFFAAALESQLDKDRILETYLSEVYLGQVGGVPIHGVEEAARGWFGVSAAHLTLPQAATIAGVIASPNTWSPVRHPDEAVKRRNVVLKSMVETGAITPAQDAEAEKAPLKIEGSLADPHRRAPWAVDVAVDELESRRDTAGPPEGWQIYTHIQPLLQRAAERAVREGMAELDREYPKAAGAEVALVAVRVSDGAVVAMVGGRDYSKSSFDRATQAWRQVGSTVKPLTLLAAFEQDPDLTPISRVVDEPITRIDESTGKPWSPQDYDHKYLGEITLRQAIEDSRNVPAVKLAETVGLDRLQGFLKSVGLARATDYHSVSLGAFEATPWEMAGAYTAFPGGGTMARPWLLRVAEQPETGDIVAQTPTFSLVASSRAAALATGILQGVITDGTGARARRYGVDAPAGGKTGTTDDYRDAWFVGFTPSLSVAVWVGRDQGGDLGLSGSRAALPTWARFIVASGTLGPDFPLPEGIVKMPVCTQSLEIARDACPTTYEELFAQGHIPSERCPLHGSAVVRVGGFFRSLFGHHQADVEGAPQPDAGGH